MDLLNSELGHTFDHIELVHQTHAVWGGVAFPGKNPGFAVVVAVGNRRHFDNYDLYVLDEFETRDVRQLVRQCAALDLKYWVSQPRTHRRDSSGKWIGDHKNDAASRFIQELNDEVKQGNRPDVPVHKPRFSLHPTMILEMDNLYPFILPHIKEFVRSDRRQLFLKGSRVVNYLNEIEGSDVAELELGAYPAIEALAFAVIELRRHIKSEEDRAHRPPRDSYGGRRPGRGRRRGYGRR